MLRRSLNIKILSLSALIFIHFIAFPTLFSDIAGAAYALSFLPIALAGVYFGVRGGVITSAIYTVLLPILLIRTSGQTFRQIPIFAHVATFFVLSFVGGVVGRLRDLHLQLKKSKAQQSLLFSQMHSGFALCEVIYNKDNKAVDYRFIYVNAAFEKLFSLDAAKVVGSTALEIFHYIEPHVLETYSRIALLGEAYTFEEFRETLHKHFEITAYCPQTGHFAAIINDISVRVRYEKEKDSLTSQLIQSDKLATLGTLAAGIAHEINNPLAIIKGFTEILSKRLQPANIQAEDEKIFTAIHKGIVRIATIVNSLRTYARADTDHVEMLDINSVIADVSSFIQGGIKHAEIEIQQNLTADIPLIKGNLAKLQQVLVNLITNACDALESRSANRQITIETQADGKHVIIQLSDNGSGIPNAVVGRIFDPFFTTKPVGKGTGLGLAITHSIVESFGGSIKVSSQEGKGSSFRIKLPRAFLPSTTPHDGDQSSIESELPKLRGEVLVVDDEHEVCAYFKEYLEEAGLTVTTIVNASAALDLLNEKRFDIVITDIRMPYLSGITLIRKALTIDLQTSARFIVINGGIVTSHSKEDQEFLRESVQGYLQKPVHKKQMLDMVRSLLPEL